MIKLMVRNYTLLLVLLLLLSPCCLAAEPAKNVLFIVADDLRANTLGCYGNTICQSPNLDALARRGVVFDRAYCQGSWCLPSRQSFMYGRYQGKGAQTIGECLREKQFHTTRVGKIFHMRVPGDIIDGTNGPDVAECWTQRFNSSGREAHTPGFYACLNQNIFTTAPENRQSTRMPHRMFVTVRYKDDSKDPQTVQPDEKSAEKAIELLGQRSREYHQNGTPFFLAVGLVRPHYPMVAPQSDFDRYPHLDNLLPSYPKEDDSDIPPMGRGQTRNASNAIGKYPENQQRFWTGYYASVTFMDRQVGRILRALKDQGLDESTMVIFCSDHGYNLGDHGFWQKSTLHEEVTRVPLIVSLPQSAATDGQNGSTKPRVVNRHEDAFAELVDLFPTICDWCGVAKPADVQGRSLNRFGHRSRRIAAVTQSAAHG
ncbi:MAG: sulfatase-like hydrolase/transferase [Planctomycetota bacterium]